MSNTDHEWEEWGRRDPYYGVITNPRYRRRDMTEEARREFFESGRTHAGHVLRTIHAGIDAAFRPRSILDFGCGVGRTLVHFAAMADEAVGADVSPSMLAEARANCDALGLANVRLVESDGLTRLDGAFDLVHSYIVLQHLPPERGLAIFGALLERAAPGGVVAVQVTYSRRAYAATGGLPPVPDPAAAPVVPAARDLRDLQVPDPEMQMNTYGLNALMFLVQRSGATRFHAEFTDHGGELGVFLFFQRPATP